MITLEKHLETSGFDASVTGLGLLVAGSVINEADEIGVITEDMEIETAAEYAEEVTPGMEEFVVVVAAQVVKGEIEIDFAASEYCC